MVDLDITVVLAGEIRNFLPQGWDYDPDLVSIDCSLDVSSISRTVESLVDCPYIIMLPASKMGMSMCEIIRRMPHNIPVVLVGESTDRDTLLYSAQLGCLDFISSDEDYATVKKRLKLYLRLNNMSNKIRKIEEKY